MNTDLYSIEIHDLRERKQIMLCKCKQCCSDDMILCTIARGRRMI